jgi:hypothetical protein
MTKKAAIVIGVGKVGDLPKLNSPSKGAKAVAKWLRSEGYDVECLTDESAPVQARNIEDAVAKFVTLPPRYSLLVVYFSGHGYWHARSDLWLLSGAPTKTSDAINLDGAMDLAKYSGISNVVFISDACRSIPDSRVGAKVTGIDAFPNYSEISKSSKIDYFKATSEARSAYEGKIGGKQQSIMTYALMSAYKQPEPNMIRQITTGTTRIYVVPNRELENYLQKKVNEILAEIDINLTQEIDANVPSSDDVYIARVRQLAKPLASKSKSPLTVESISMMSAGRDAAVTIARTLNLSGIGAEHDEIDANELLAVYNFATETKMQSRLPSGVIEHFESMVGFTVQGAKVVKAVTTRGKNNATVELLEEGDGMEVAGVIRLWDVRPAVSVAIQLEDGRCAILAGLSGYIGHAIIDDQGLVNVSYVPSSNNWRWQMYENKKATIDRLRAFVALAVEDHTFQIRSDDEAVALGKKIRMEKATDPTLGLYASHAFSQAANDEMVISVMGYMRKDLQADLFDVRALASRNVQESWGDFPLVPFCPLLTQTWNLLRPRGITLPPILQEAKPYLCNSLWTTFQPEVTPHIIQAIEKGELQ